MILIFVFFYSEFSNVAVLYDLLPFMSRVRSKGRPTLTTFRVRWVCLRIFMIKVNNWNRS